MQTQTLFRRDRNVNRTALGRVEKALVRDGVRLNCCAQITAIRREGEEKVLTLEGETGGELRVDAILVGVGRAPNVEGLDLEAAVVEYDRAGVSVDERLQTSQPRIYAAGDICFPYKFTHTADSMARIVIQNALFHGRAKTSALTIPWSTYTDPEIAHVGLYEHEAEKQGIPVDTFAVELATVDRAILDGEDEGFVKVHVKEGTDTILGATIVAKHAGDMISEITLAIVSRKGLGTIAKTIHPYPTQAEAIKKIADAYSRTRLTPFVKSLFMKWLAWTR